MDSQERLVYRLGGAAALLQLGSLLVAIVVVAFLGAPPERLDEIYALLHETPGVGLLRMELPLLPLVGLYLVLGPALALALWRTHPVYATQSALMTVVAVLCFFSSHPAFSLLHLSHRYAAAMAPEQRAALLAAGEAMIAADGWNSSAGYLSGLLLQGAGVLVSILMLRSRAFNGITAVAGLIANAVDLVQHLLHPFAPALAAAILPVAGPFYLLWFPMLAWSLFRLASGRTRVQGSVKAGAA
jgi:hypothetical protein